MKYDIKVIAMPENSPCLWDCTSFDSMVQRTGVLPGIYSRAVSPRMLTWSLLHRASQQPKQLLCEVGCSTSQIATVLVHMKPTQGSSRPMPLSLVLCTKSKVFIVPAPSVAYASKCFRGMPLVSPVPITLAAVEHSPAPQSCVASTGVSIVEKT